MRRSSDEADPHLHLDGDQPTIYRKRPRWKRILKWTALTLAVVLSALFVWGYVWLKSKEGGMHVAGAQSSLDKTASGQPVNTLVMGLDRGSVPGEEDVARTDIMMLVSVDSKHKKAAVISIPRDTRVKIPGKSNYYKINAAHAIGGPELAIETVKSFTGLPIHHYAVIDFEGFKQIVNAVGGVPMHIDVAIHDKYAGDVPAGDVVLNGDQALAFVRARHDPNAVPAGDLDRVKNQRKFLQAMLSCVSHTRSPFKIISLVDAVSANVKTDMTFMGMLSLGRSLQGSGKDGVQMTTAPGQAKIIGGAWYYIVDEAAFKELLSTFATKTEVGPEATTPEPGSARSQISVMVLNGAGKAGLASSVANELADRGYKKVQTGNAKSPCSRTTIYYAGGDSSQAGLVAADLRGAEEPILEKDDDLVSGYGVDVVTILGADYQ